MDNLAGAGGAGMILGADVSLRAALEQCARVSHRYAVQCRRPDGSIRWEDWIENLVVTEGRNYYLNAGLKGVAQISSWFVGLTAASPTVAAGDTLASHAGWTEFSAYTEAARQALTLGTVAAGSVDNSANKATFSINANGSSIGGLFIASASTGTAGTLLGAGAFTGGNKPADDGDTLSVTATLSLTSS